MKNIVIVGGGFAGLACAKKLSRHAKRLGFGITLINDKESSHFLPMLPDSLSTRMPAEYLIFDLAGFINKYNLNFIKAKVTGIDLAKKEVSASALTIGYDLLLIASGSETNFYGNDRIRESAFKLDDAGDAALIRKAVEGGRYDCYCVAGGGYTGIETATNLRLALGKENAGKKVVIVERAPSILGPLPIWMKDYVLDNLKAMDIEVLTGSAISEASGNKVSLSSGRAFDNAMLIWAAGVRAADLIQSLNVEKNPQGRIKVDEYLRLNDSSFAAGDAAAFFHKKDYLRMAVQFSLAQGDRAAVNIIRSIQGKRPVKYSPIDLGYIIPMANNKACGIILGVKVKGFFPVLMHYLMCAYRSFGLKNKLGVIRSAIYLLNPFP